MELFADNDRIDELAVAGYRYAACSGPIVTLNGQFEIDAFNSGISNFNGKHNAHVPKLLEGMKKIYIEGSNNGRSDKELAIVGA